MRSEYYSIYYISDIKWGTMDAPTNPIQQQFTAHHWPTEPLGCDTIPVDFFNQLFPDELWDLLVDQTNVYGHQKGTKYFSDTSLPEMQAFICLLYAMGIHHLPELNDYFSEDWVLGVPAFQAVFTRNRWWALWSHIHLADNEQASQRQRPRDKLYKVRPAIHTSWSMFQEKYDIGAHISVDELMLKGMGRNHFKIYMSANLIKRGTKIWEVACSDCAYLYDL